MSSNAPLMPPTDEEMAAGQSRLAVAIDKLVVEEQAAKAALQRRTDARAEVKNASHSWREMRRQANIVEQFSMDIDLDPGHGAGADPEVDE
jgi:N-acetylmuramoyl-L-alanine amidase